MIYPQSRMKNFNTSPVRKILNLRNVFDLKITTSVLIFLTYMITYFLKKANLISYYVLVKPRLSGIMEVRALWTVNILSFTYFVLSYLYSVNS